MRNALTHLMLWLVFACAILGLIYCLVPILGRPAAVDDVDAWEVFDRATMVIGYVVTTGAIYTAIVARRELFALLSRRHQPDEGTLAARGDTEVLVMLYFQNSDLGDIAINALQPKLVALLGSDALDVGQYIDRLKTSHPLLLVEHEVVSDRNDFQEAKSKAAQLIARARLKAQYSGIDADKISCDITGTTKPMTIGIFMAAEEAGVSTLYVKAEYDSKRKPIPGTHQIIFVRRYQAVR